MTEEIQQFWIANNVPCEKRKVDVYENGRVIMQADTLQILTPRGEWVDAEPVFRDIISRNVKKLLLDAADKPTIYNYISNIK